VLLVLDETTLRLLPPLRAAWALRGQQAQVPISGRNDQRVLFGALNVANGRRLLLRRKRACAADFQAFLRHLRQRHYRAGQPLWLLLDRATCHVAAGSLALAAELDMTLLWLPRQCSELNAMDHLWRHLKEDLAANRQRPTMDALEILSNVVYGGITHPPGLLSCLLVFSRLKAVHETDAADDFGQLFGPV
jgi:hypothetical protein